MFSLCYLYTGSLFPGIDTRKMETRKMVLKTCSWALTYNFVIQYTQSMQCRLYWSLKLCYTDTHNDTVRCKVTRKAIKTTTEFPTYGINFPLWHLYPGDIMCSKQ